MGARVKPLPPPSVGRGRVLLSLRVWDFGLGLKKKMFRLKGSSLLLSVETPAGVLTPALFRKLGQVRGLGNIIPNLKPGHQAWRKLSTGTAIPQFTMP